MKVCYCTLHTSKSTPAHDYLLTPAKKNSTPGFVKLNCMQACEAEAGRKKKACEEEMNSSLKVLHEISETNVR